MPTAQALQGEVAETACRKLVVDFPLTGAVQPVQAAAEAPGPFAAIRPVAMMPIKKAVRSREQSKLTEDMPSPSEKDSSDRAILVWRRCPVKSCVIRVDRGLTQLRGACCDYLAAGRRRLQLGFVTRLTPGRIFRHRADTRGSKSVSLG